MTTPVPPPTPMATLKPGRRLLLGWYWLIPLLVAGVLGGVLYQSWSQRGEKITLHFNEGHGLKPGDAVRCRGITVGEVRSVDLSADLKGVDVVVELRPSAKGVAVEGSRFWIVRPQADLTGLSGLDTVVGAKYVAVLPGTGGALREFTGLEEPPVLERTEPGGLHIVVAADRKGGLRAGVPLTYRQIRIGVVERAQLASDASAVEIHLYVNPEYAVLVRKNSEFWNVSGFKVQGGLSGLTLSADSAETVLAGGIAMATPTDAGEQARTGQRFIMRDKPVDDPRKYTPSLLLTSPHLPLGVTAPRLVKSTLHYPVSFLVLSSKQAEHRGLLLPVEDTLLGPGELLTVPNDASGPGELAYEGQAIKLNKEPGTFVVRRLAAKVSGTSLADSRLRIPGPPEDCLLFNDSGVPVFVPVARLTQPDANWTLHPSVSSELTPANWHGAAVVAKKDGAVIGVLLVKEKTPIVIVPLTAETVKR